LGDERDAEKGIACNICGSESVHAFNTEMLRKYRADFFQCVHCGYLRTPDPHWLDEAYSEAIAAADTGVVQRNISLRRRCAPLLYFLFPKKKPFLDQAGGYGIFVRMMRDMGFDFYWEDKYCENLMARGFEAKPDQDFSAVTAFEVLEHVPDPLQFIEETLSAAHSETLIFSTELFKGDPPSPGNWWYYAFEAGQHISFFQYRTLEVIADRLERYVYSNGSLHMLSKKKVNPLIFKILTTSVLEPILRIPLSIRMESLVVADHEKAIKRE
jgi:hypothetical protein